MDLRPCYERRNGDLCLKCFEGWHKRLNNMAHSQQSVNLYKLIDLLHTESLNVRLQSQMVANGVVLRRRRATFIRTQAIIMKSWDQLRDGDITAKQVLKICSRVNGPVVDV